MPSIYERGAIASFGWLWLTDLHFGQYGQKWLWPNRREDFFEDVRRLYPECGPWDVVLFTGDLVFSGLEKEFAELTPVIGQLLEEIRHLQQVPLYFLSVPGNHDLTRPDPKTPVAAAFRNWWQDDIVRSSFWGDADSEYRVAITKMFTSYTQWSERNGFPRPPDFHIGLLPGDFSATIAKGDARLGIVGINSTFLQLSGGDYEGKLDLDPRQLAQACGGDAAEWLKQRQANFLLTHQPYTWLSGSAQTQFRGSIYTPRNFAAQFHGHMHEHKALVISEGGDIPRRYFQGASLFGLEHFGEAFDKDRFKFGYLAGRLEMDRDKGRLYLWPRIAKMQQSGDWRLVPDVEQSLARGSEHTFAIEFELRIPFGAASGGLSSPVDRLESPKTVSSLEDPPRIMHLRRLKAESEARCVMRWQAARVPRELAYEFANDPKVGPPSLEMLPSTQNPIVLLVGPIGSGKSLIGERLHQAAIEKAIMDPAAPTPVYLEAPSAISKLASLVDNKVAAAGGKWADGAAVFLHEAIGGETADVRILLNEARVLVGSWPKTTVILLSRDIAQPTQYEEKVRVPPLSDEAAFMIVNRVSGLSISPTLFSLPSSVREAIRRPLFALLLGHYIRTTPSKGPRSRADLIANLVSEALRQMKTDRVEAESLLQRLATELTDRGGGFIPIREIVSTHEGPIVQHLLDSGLITKRDETIAFPLAILTEWFAAQSLASGNPIIDDVARDAKRLNHWYFALLRRAAGLNFPAAR